MEISVSLRVRSGGSWASIADKSASLEMPVSEEDADWKESVKDKLQFFMQEAAEMIIPAVKKSVDAYENPAVPIGPAETPRPADKKELETPPVPEGENETGGIPNPFA